MTALAGTTRRNHRMALARPTIFNSASVNLLCFAQGLAFAVTTSAVQPWTGGGGTENDE